MLRFFTLLACEIVHEMSCPEVVENHRILCRASEIASILSGELVRRLRMLSHLSDFGPRILKLRAYNSKIYFFYIFYNFYTL